MFANRWLRLALLAALPGPAFAQEHQLPYFFPVETVHAQGVREIETIISRGSWHLLGRNPEGYRIGSGKTDGMTGAGTIALQSCNENALLGHGSLERTIPADDYAGGRIRVTARTKHVGAGYSALYINLLGPKGRHLRHVSLNNIGNGQWESKAIVADVEDGILALDIGVALWGSSASTVWLESVSIEAVPKDVSLNGESEPVVFVSNSYIVSCNGLRDGIREQQ